MTTVVAHGKTAAFAPHRLLQPGLPLKVVVGPHEHVVLRQDRIRGRQASIVYDGCMDVKLEQQRRLQATTSWARKIRSHLGHVLAAHGDEVHFRPGSTGVSMVGLLHDRPQRGRSGITDLEAFARSYASEFEKHCRSVTQGRPTGEKALQSFLIRDAFKNGGRLQALNDASNVTDEAVQLTFVTDEIALPFGEGKIVCDVLALRHDHGRRTPVLLELKDTRAMDRLIEQVETYAALIDEQAELFAELFGALLGEELRFDGPTEKWMVWPQKGERVDPQEDQLAARNIRVVGYTERAGVYTLRVGRSAGTLVASLPATAGMTHVQTAERQGVPVLPLPPDRRDRILGCLLGGAIGDALGGAVEFMSLANIRRAFGDEGISEYAATYGRVGAITDDTQMTLFTAEGLLRSQVRCVVHGSSDIPSVVHHAYLRWLATQGIKAKTNVGPNPADPAQSWPDGWLIQHKELWNRRAPGATCISALSAAVNLGDSADNDSKGCGTIMRVAPVGLWCESSPTNPALAAFDVGIAVSRLTHGHPSGYLAGGYFAQLIALLLDGHDLSRAIDDACLPLREHGEDAAEVLAAIEAARRLAEKQDKPTPEQVESLGAGWVAEEALSIAVYCALVAQDFDHGVRLAVNHSGDSDSTGSLVGNLLGVMGGATKIPAHWLDDLELHAVIVDIASDMATMHDAAWDRVPTAVKYPGW